MPFLALHAITVLIKARKVQNTERRKDLELLERWETNQLSEEGLEERKRSVRKD